MCTCNNENWSDCSEDVRSGEAGCENTWEETTNNEDDCYSNSTRNSSEGNDLEDDGWCDESECNDVTQKLVMNPSVYVVKAGVTIPFTVSTYPCREDVTNSATWRSSNTSVASVDQKGKVTTRRDGTATITATYNGMTATCNLTVDSRPLVRVVKMSEGDHFFVNFVNQKEGEAYRWKSVGCDLDLQENRSGYDIWNDDEDLLNTAERNYKYNCGQNYTENQLALLYRLDPFGVILYVKNYAEKHYGNDEKKLLDYKDRVYIAIFGYDEENFYFRPDSNGNIVYYRLNNLADRADYYSHAEALFGEHIIIDGKLLLKAVATLLFDIFLSWLDKNDKDTSALDLIQMVLYTRSISDVSETLVENYIKADLADVYKLYKPLKIFFDFLENISEAIYMFSLTDYEFGRSMRKTKYRVALIKDGTERYIEEFVL